MVKTQQEDERVNEIATIGGTVKMTSLDIAELTGKNHQHIMRDIRNEQSALGSELGQSIFGQSSYLNSQDKKQPMYVFGKDGAMQLALKYDAKTRYKVIKRLEELERSQRTTLPATYLAALEALVVAERAKELAISTKAEIGHRREATAMNTASQAVKKASQLEMELDRSKDYYTVKRMIMLCHGQKFNWRLLKSAAIEMSMPAIDVFDQNYGTVKAYHRDVWQEAYAINL